jgi:hypothetical protein
MTNWQTSRHEPARFPFTSCDTFFQNIAGTPLNTTQKLITCEFLTYALKPHNNGNISEICGSSGGGIARVTLQVLR